jgi:hypothetical protein
MHNIWIYKDLWNKGYAPGLVLGRCKVRGVRHGWLLKLLLVLLDDFLVVLLLYGHVLDLLVIYKHAMITRHLIMVTTVDFNKEKGQITLRIIDPGTHNPWIMKRSNLPPELSKTVYFTLWVVFDGGFATVTNGCYSNGGFCLFPYFRWIFEKS